MDIFNCVSIEKLFEVLLDKVLNIKSDSTLLVLALKSIDAHMSILRRVQDNIFDAIVHRSSYFSSLHHVDIKLMG